jgi:antitoxin MazE
MLTKVQKWGNSFAVRLPRAVVQKAGVKEGETLEIDAEGRQIHMRRARRRSYSLAGLVARIRPGNRHGEADFGEPQGRELL